MDNDTSDVFLCPRCGEKLKVGTSFCHNCGLKIEENKIKIEHLKDKTSIRL